MNEAYRGSMCCRGELQKVKEGFLRVSRGSMTLL